VAVLDATMRRGELDAVLDRLSEAPSLITGQRACLAFSGGGRAPDVRDRRGFGMCWVRSSVPWWLLPLRFIVAGDRCLVEITEGNNLLTFAREADQCFKLQFYSFARERVANVFEHLGAGGLTTDPGEVIDQDPGFLELEVFCDGGSHEIWHASARTGRECPEDLVRAVAQLDAT
jgi:hypothetical protein